MSQQVIRLYSNIQTTDCGVAPCGLIYRETIFVVVIRQYMANTYHTVKKRTDNTSRKPDYSSSPRRALLCTLLAVPVL